MKMAILGTTQFSIECAKKFMELGSDIKLFISLPYEKLPLNSANTETFAKEYGIPYCEYIDVNSKEAEGRLKECGLDYIFSSWPYIIKKNILDVPKYFVIGSHPTSLPYNRGRHPLHWLISQGIEKSDISLFKMKEGIDDGDILVQYPFECKYEIGIADVYRNMIDSTLIAIELLYDILKKDANALGTSQNNVLANYWRKKNIYDVMIDFRMTAMDIVKVVKSFNLPYKCAIFAFENNIIRVSDAELYEKKMDLEEKKRMEPGKIVKKDENKLYVKSSDEIVVLECLDCIDTIEIKNYIYPPSKYMIEHFNFYSKKIN